MILPFVSEDQYGRREEEQATIGDKLMIEVDRAVVAALGQVVLNVVQAAVDEAVVAGGGTSGVNV